MLLSGFSFQVAEPLVFDSIEAFKFPSRYRAAFHFRIPRKSHAAFPAPVSISLSSGFSFQVEGQVECPGGSRNRVSISLSSGFSFQVKTPTLVWDCSYVSISLSSGFSFQGQGKNREWRACLVSISLSSGFSFQADGNLASPFKIEWKFPSRYRAASHFRGYCGVCRGSWVCFNLVIERLLISGTPRRLSAASVRFNLVIERLLISGRLGTALWRAFDVSISLSSGFSFQVS